MTKTFEAGKTYYTRSVCDHDHIIRVKIVGRTAKTVKTDNADEFLARIFSGLTIEAATWTTGE